ncbi:IS630 transposase-related protein, partial [Rubritepida flocculans]
MTWRSGQAYSQDLRERVLAAVDGGLRVREVAPLFRVSISYIYKALARRAATGATTASARGGARRKAVLAGHE